MSDHLQKLQLASLLAPGLTRRHLRLASVTAADGTALFSAANRKRTSFWVEGTGHDGIRRHFQMTVQRGRASADRDHVPLGIGEMGCLRSGASHLPLQPGFRRAPEAARAGGCILSRRWCGSNEIPSAHLRRIQKPNERHYLGPGPPSRHTHARAARRHYQSESADPGSYKNSLWQMDGRSVSRRATSYRTLPSIP